MHPALQRVQGGLIVSCQADPGDPLYGPNFMVAMARAAVAGGAVGIRSNSPDEVGAIRQAIALPLIGLYKKHYDGADVYITPTMDEVRAIAEAGADMVAVQLTDQSRADLMDKAGFVTAIRREFPNLGIMADIATLAEGLDAADLGVDVISTTMSGYTPYSSQIEGPDLTLVRDLARAVAVPVIAEGRIRTPADCRQALDAGAFAVVVGTAITRPQMITARFAQALREP